jgi:hypothetical protein
MAGIRPRRPAGQRPHCPLRLNRARGLLGAVASAAVLLRPRLFYAHGLATLSPLLVPGWLLSLLFGPYLTIWLYLSSGASLMVVAIFHGAVDLVTITPASNALILVTVNAGLIAAAVRGHPVGPDPQHPRTPPWR